MSTNRRIDVPAWIEDPNVYTMLITDQLILTGATECDPDTIAETALAVAWPKARGTYEMMKLDDARFAIAVNAAARKLTLDLDPKRYRVSIVRERGQIAVTDRGEPLLRPCDECDPSFGCFSDPAVCSKRPMATAFYFVRVALITPNPTEPERENPS